MSTGELRQESVQRAVLCTRCWCAISLDRGDGLKQNRDRKRKMCSHLGPFIAMVRDPASSQNG